MFSQYEVMQFRSQPLSTVGETGDKLGKQHDTILLLKESDVLWKYSPYEILHRDKEAALERNTAQPPLTEEACF